MAPASKTATSKWQPKQPGPVALAEAKVGAACRSSFDQAKECPGAVCKSGFFPRLTPEGATLDPRRFSDTSSAPEITPETIVSWADASIWEDSSTQSSSSPRLAKKPKDEGACPEEVPPTSALPDAPEEETATKNSRRSHRRRRRRHGGAAEATIPSEADGFVSDMPSRGPPNVVTLGDLGFDLGPRGAHRDASIPEVSMPAPSATAAVLNSQESEQRWVGVPSPCRAGFARPQPMPLSTGMSTMSPLPEGYPTSPLKATRDASSRQAVTPVAVGPWNLSGAPPGNLSPVHSTSLARRAPALLIEPGATAAAPASSQPITPGPQSPQICSGIMSTQPIPKPRAGDMNETADRVNPKVPAWSPAGTPQADVLRSCLHASGLQFHADLADQLRAAAPEIYED